MEKPGTAPAAPITCGPENVAGFNARLRGELPELFAFAKEARQIGMIDGLAGARIGPVGSLGWAGKGVVPSIAAGSGLPAVRTAPKAMIR